MAHEFLVTIVNFVKIPGFVHQGTHRIVLILTQRPALHHHKLILHADLLQRQFEFSYVGCWMRQDTARYRREAKPAQLEFSLEATTSSLEI